MPLQDTALMTAIGAMGLAFAAVGRWLMGKHSKDIQRNTDAVAVLAKAVSENTTEVRRVVDLLPRATGKRAAG